jgi:hypothetical protein
MPSQRFRHYRYVLVYQPFRSGRRIEGDSFFALFLGHCVDLYENRPDTPQKDDSSGCPLLKLTICFTLLEHHETLFDLL